MANEEQLAILKQGVEVWNKWRKENPDIAIDLSAIYLREVNLEKINFEKANLERANLVAISLKEANLKGANLGSADLSSVNFEGANLYKTKFCSAYVWFSNLKAANLEQANLIESKFYGGCLSEANFEKARLISSKLFDTDLRFANLIDAQLMYCEALETNFCNANLTGACIQDWNINSKTQFDDVICEYIYFGCEDDEETYTDRRPHDPSKIFAPEDFARLVQQSHATVDLIFSEGIDWSAFLNSFQSLQIEGDRGELSVQAIEKKCDGSFVVRVEVPENADKGEIEQSFHRKYDAELQQLEAIYQEKLQAKETEIAIYKKQSADMMEIVKLQASRSPILQINQTQSDRSVKIADNQIQGAAYTENSQGSADTEGNTTHY